MGVHGLSFEKLQNEDGKIQNALFMLCFLGVHVKNFSGVVTADPFYYHPDIQHTDHHNRLGNLCRGL